MAVSAGEELTSISLQTFEITVQNDKSCNFL